jgi:hypothetical protein
VIYFIRRPDDGSIKIGTTELLSARLGQLKAQHPGDLTVLGVISGSYADERALHDRFAHLRGDGEWFRAGDDLMEFIRQESRSWGGPGDEGSPIRIDSALAAQAKYLAALRGIPTSDYLSELLRPALDREMRKAGRDLMEGEGSPK